MGFLDWIMKGIGFDSDEDEDAVDTKQKTKSRRQKRLERKQESKIKDIEPENQSSNFGRPAFSSSSQNVFTGTEAFSQPQQSNYSDSFDSMGGSVGGYGSKNFVFFSPKSYDDVKSLINYMRQGEPAIINLDEISDSEAQRILDFISGAVCALAGSVQRISGNIFLIAPEGFNIRLPQGQ